MNNKTILFVMLSLIFGVFAVYLAQNWLQTNSQTATNQKMVNVITMASEVPLGAIIERKHLSLTSVPSHLVPKGAMDDLNQTVGKVVKQRLYQGEVLRQERLTTKGEGSTLASLITPNMRAVTIRVNDVVGVAGFILPGNHVDIINIFTSGGLKTDIVLSNVKILAIDQRASNDENKPMLVRAVTLELSLNQAETLMIAKSRGSLQLALRNPNDTAVVELAILEEIDNVQAKESSKVSINSNIGSQIYSNKVLLLKGIKEQEIKIEN